MSRPMTGCKPCASDGEQSVIVSLQSHPDRYSPAATNNRTMDTKFPESEVVLPDSDGCGYILQMRRRFAYPR